MYWDDAWPWVGAPSPASFDKRCLTLGKVQLSTMCTGGGGVRAQSGGLNGALPSSFGVLSTQLCLVPPPCIVSTAASGVSGPPPPPPEVRGRAAIVTEPGQCQSDVFWSYVLK